MSVEIVQYEMNRDRCRVYRLQQILDERHKVHLGAAGGNLDAAALALGSMATKMLRVPARLYS